MSQKEGERAAAQDNLLSETFKPALPVASPDLLFSTFSQLSVKDINLHIIYMIIYYNVINVYI